MAGRFKIEISSDGGKSWRRRSGHKSLLDAKVQLGRIARGELRLLDWRIVDTGAVVFEVAGEEARAVR